jgi:hypothetical protein
MYIQTPQKTASKLECIFQSFLWGYNAEGGKNTALVAWTKLIQIKAEGGLGLKDIYKHSAALLSCWVIEALDQPLCDWACMFNTNVPPLYCAPGAFKSNFWQKDRN